MTRRLLLFTSILLACTTAPSPSKGDISAAFIAADRGDPSCAVGSTYDTIRSRSFPQTTIIRQTCTYEHGRPAWRLVALDGTQAIPLSNDYGVAELLARHAPVVVAREDAVEYGLLMAELTGVLEHPYRRISVAEELPDSLRRFLRFSSTPLLLGPSDRWAHFWIPIYHPSSRYDPGYLWRIDGAVSLASGKVEFRKIVLWEEPLPIH